MYAYRFHGWNVFFSPLLLVLVLVVLVVLLLLVVLVLVLFALFIKKRFFALSWLVACIHTDVTNTIIY